MNKDLKIEKLISKELSGSKVFQNASYITQFLRAPGSSGLHTVLEYLENKLYEYNLEDFEKIEYPSYDHYTENLNFIGWDIKDAKLQVVEPEFHEVVSFDEAPTCIQWWSSRTAEEGVTAELVDVESGLDESIYEKVDVKGKVVLARGNDTAEGNTRIYQLAVQKFGAIGFITDSLPYTQEPYRNRENHPEAISFLRLRTKSNDGWAFSISLTQGEYLRRLLKNGTVMVRSIIDSEYTDTKDWELVASIKGDNYPEEEVWFVTHCSGPKPGANCASGAALGIEISRTIKRLIDDGKIPRPKRTIKFLVGLEGDGFNAYLEKYKDKKIKVKAGFVFCSVGDKQEECKSSLLLYRSPESIYSYVNDICEEAIEIFSKDALTPYSAEKPDIPMIRFHSGPFTPMSDNSRLMMMKIPCPTFWSWPSRHFHTQFYTADKLDPDAMKRCGEIAAYVALVIADADEETAIDIAEIIRKRTLSRLLKISSNATKELSSDSDELEIKRHIDKIKYIIERDTKSLMSLKDLINENVNQPYLYLEKIRKEFDEIKEKEINHIHKHIKLKEVSV